MIEWRKNISNCACVVRVALPGPPTFRGHATLLSICSIQSGSVVMGHCFLTRKVAGLSYVDEVKGTL